MSAPQKRATITRQQVRQALKRWHTTTDLGKMDLAQLAAVSAVCRQHQFALTSTGRGLALRHLLRDQLDALKPTNSRDPDLTNRHWRAYLILQGQFVEQRAAQSVRADLGISESGYFNDQRRALDLIAQRLQALELHATPTSAEIPTATLPPISTPTLPQPPTTFFGREAERAELARLLARPNVQLITLVGTGGMGKTRLAIQAAQDYHARTGEAVAFVALARANSAEMMVSLIAQAVQLSFDAHDAPTQQLISFLRSRSLLLVLDNLEQLLPDASTFLQDLLAAAPRVRVLTTSRESLQLRSEWVLSLMGLTVPPDSAEVDELSTYSAGALFLAALRRRRGPGDLADGEAAAIVEICRLVDGMPLALELAASWGNVLTCGEISAEICQSLSFLAGAYRDLPARHQSLRAVFDHSWRLLNAAEQAIFCKLAVFEGDFGREAAADVAGAHLPALQSLTSKSLLRVSAEMRYAIHPLLRDFAAERLRERPDLQAEAAIAHSQFYLEWVTCHTEGLRQGMGQRATIDAFAAELENVRAAWHTAVANGLWALLRDAALGLSDFYQVANRFREGLELLQSTAEALTTAESSEVVDPLRGLIDGLLGRILLVLGKSAESQTAFRASLSRLEASDSAELLAMVQLYAIEANFTEPRWQPEALYAAALAHFQQVGDEWAIAYAHVKYVSYLRLSAVAAAPDEQRALLLQSLALRERIGDQRGVASTLSLLGDLAYERGDYEAAQDYATRSLALYDELGDNLRRAMALNHLGQVAGSKGKYLAAKRYYEESLALLRAHSNPREVAMCLDCVGYVTYLLNDLVTAESHYRESLELSRALNDVAGIAWSLHNLGDIARARHDLAQALTLYQQSYDLHHSVDADGWGSTVALDKLGRVRLERNELDSAEVHFERALAIAQRTGRYREMLDALLNLAQVAMRRGDRDSAEGLLTTVVNHSAAAQDTYEKALALLEG